MARVTRFGRERGLALETGSRESQKTAQKRGADPRSGARCVGCFQELKPILILQPTPLYDGECIDGYIGYSIFL